MELRIRITAEVIACHPQLDTVVPVLLKKIRQCLNYVYSFSTESYANKNNITISHLISKWFHGVQF